MGNTAEWIAEGKGILGIEFGSTRIKAVLIDEEHRPVAGGDHVWENHLEGGYWTYHQDEILNGLQDCYAKLKENVEKTYGVKLKKIAAMGVSAMMHGYLAFDADGKLLVPFRTWRNSTTGEAAEALSSLFHYNIPQRWSIAHLYQAVLNGEDHVGNVAFLTTLAGYIHWQLTGEKVIGVGDASGMFPIDPKTGGYDEAMADKFDALAADRGYGWKLREILPQICSAGEDAGRMTMEGARLLDPTGELEEGCRMAPPEGDAGTGMAATNSVRQRTGNISAGTSCFAMVVLEKELNGYYPQIDMVTTPDGSPVAMVHANNCTSDLNAWVGLCREILHTFGKEVDEGDLYQTLYTKALEGDPDCGGLLSYGFLSGENIMDCTEGRPMFIRTPEAKFTLANFMRSHLYASFGALKVGMDLLLQKEKIAIDTIYGHGGIFKTKGVAQNFLAAAIRTPVSVMETAGEGGPWGMALLAAYLVNKADGETLADYLERAVFADAKGSSVEPDIADAEGFEAYIRRFQAAVGAEQIAAEKLQ